MLITTHPTSSGQWGSVRMTAPPEFILQDVARWYKGYELFPYKIAITYCAQIVQEAFYTWNPSESIILSTSLLDGS